MGLCDIAGGSLSWLVYILLPKVQLGFSLLWNFGKIMQPNEGRD